MDFHFISYLPSSKLNSSLWNSQKTTSWSFILVTSYSCIKQRNINGTRHQSNYYIWHDFINFIRFKTNRFWSQFKIRPKSFLRRSKIGRCINCIILIFHLCIYWLIRRFNRNRSRKCYSYNNVINIQWLSYNYAWRNV